MLTNKIRSFPTRNLSFLCSAFKKFSTTSISIMSTNDNDRILLVNYPKLPLDKEYVDELVDEAHDFAHSFGLVMRTPSTKASSYLCQSAPFALLPSPFPKNLFEKAVNVQNATASLYHDIAYDYEFIVKTHKNVLKSDEFTKKMMEIYEEVMKEGLVQPVTLAIQRSDYMTHKNDHSGEYYLKQVEVNNIASSMGAHAERVTKLHKNTLLRLGFDESFVKKTIPENNPILLIAEALFKAWNFFENPKAYILVVVEEINQNQIDQRLVDYKLEELGVPLSRIIRKTFSDCYKTMELTDNKLLYNGDEIAVVYFRAGYSPDHYKSEDDWKMRLMMEKSTAIKAPWIGLQLANTKKTQQVLAEDGTVEQFVESTREAAAIRSVFANMWALDKNDSLTLKVVNSAINHDDKFVLKPQLEGGAGNFYGKEMTDLLKTLKDDEKGAYILMEKLKPLVFENYLIRGNQTSQLSKTVSELGIYGYAFGVRGNPETKTSGHLLRTKGETVNEGGVAVGHAVIDSPFLYEFI